MNEQSIEHLEREYAERSGVTVRSLHAWGRFGAPCACGIPTCDGFQMLHLYDALVEAGWRPPVDDQQ